MAVLDNVTRVISAGLQRLDFHVLDTNGLPAGVTGSMTGIAAGVGASAGRITSVKAVPINVPAADGVPVTGDNILVGTFMFPSTAPRIYEVTFAEDDFADRLAFQNVKTRNIGTASFVGQDTAPFNLNNVAFIGVSNAQAQSAGAKGLGNYTGFIANRAQMLMRGRDAYTERAAGTYTGSMILNAADSFPWGETFTIGVHGITSGFSDVWTSAYPQTMHRFNADNAETVFTLAETPASTSLNDVLVFDLDANNVPTRKTTGVTIDTTAKTLTFLSAPTTNHVLIVFYGYVPS